MLNNAFQRPLEFFDLILNLRMHLVVKGGEGAEKRRLKTLHIFDQIVRAIAAITNSIAIHDGAGVRDLLVHMRERHIGQVDVVLSEVESDVVRGYLA